ncbi:Sensor protein FixL [Legionella massiliensis]|uniref:histidine kinase n=1 Tax=Legionella massiliensis TaxID=1034943 RepID=A0A078KVX6_9GAMM|nr:MHYT domain-containing protein [Legionella massiliensis]CDZ77162.1 Sensor protein FixL [Legionella massiliensis]CEE12900.1 Sensor protein FixL [Legionella massiliensis]
MYSDFFQGADLSANQFEGVYDLRLVLLSYLVAVFASYIALDLTGRLRDRSNSPTISLIWLIGGAIAMGAGIWSMHFIGMLSFSIPGLNLQYDLFWTAVSLVVAIAASGFALLLLRKSIINVIHLISGGLILGLAIASMHYTGMAALIYSLNIRFLPGLFFLSVIVAIIASGAAIWFALKSNAVVLRLRNRIKVLSAIIMGLGISGMHYTGMAASIFTPLCQPVLVNEPAIIDPSVLAITIAAVTFVILAIAFFASSYKESLNQEQFEKARALGIAEISASVLHNVGNVLNSINVSVQSMTEQLTGSPLQKLQKLSSLLKENKPNLGEFVSSDPRGIHIVDFIDELAVCLQKEQELLINELQDSHKNIGLIKNIIATQQDVTKVKAIDQVVSIKELLDEVLLLSGIDQEQTITVNKNYGEIHPILIERVKLIQILSNLINNAKDALLDSTNANKQLNISTSITSKGKIAIVISDNGTGITRANLNKIFIFGYTTKKSGHGFGLHATAIAINELGGEIRVDSEGKDKGAVFTIYLPYKKINPLANL